MTPAHPSVDQLADLSSGALPRDRAARLEEHVAACTDCTAVVSDLTRVSELLASVPAPGMPSQVAARLDAVLTAESARRTGSQDVGRRAEILAASEGGAGSDRPRTGASVHRLRGSSGSTPTGADRSGRRRWRSVALAAASVAIVGGGAAFLAPQPGDGDATTAESMGGGRVSQDRADAGSAAERLESRDADPKAGGQDGVPPAPANPAPSAGDNQSVDRAAELAESPRAGAQMALRLGMSAS